MTDIVIEPLALHHVAAVAEIERLVFSEPWTESGIYKTAESGGSRFIVALLGEKVVGYGGMLTVLDEGYIANIAAHPSHRRLGIGRKVVRNIAKIGRDMGLSFITLEVRVSNEAAIELYKSEGFVLDGQRPGYYERPREDAFIMTLKLK